LSNPIEGLAFGQIAFIMRVDVAVAIRNIPARIRIDPVRVNRSES